ncbi:MAG: HupE/UreJ family protein, partial [Pontibacterium sp.]
AKVVTAFTLGHSITLCLAAFELVYLPARWVELAIAMTVLWSAGANLARSLWGDIDAARTTSSLFGVVFCFGLIHGFGFANVLFALDMPQSQFVVALLGFNLGLEFAQLGIVLLIVPLLVPLRRYKGLFMSLIRAISLAAGGLAVYWISQRI